MWRSTLPRRSCWPSPARADSWVEQSTLRSDKRRGAFDGQPARDTSRLHPSRRRDRKSRSADRSAVTRPRSRARSAGHTLFGAESGRRYGITDAAGRTPPSHRETLREPRTPSSVVVRRRSAADQDPQAVVSDLQCDVGDPVVPVPHRTEFESPCQGPAGVLVESVLAGRADRAVHLMRIADHDRGGVPSTRTCHRHKEFKTRGRPLACDCDRQCRLGGRAGAQPRRRYLRSGAVPPGTWSAVGRTARVTSRVRWTVQRPVQRGAHLY